MTKKVYAIDLGKSYVKYSNGSNFNKFENLVLAKKGEKKPNNDFAFDVELGLEDNTLKKYLVGNKVNTLKEYSSNKIIENNKIAAYVAITRLLLEEEEKQEEIEIHLVTGLPNQHYSDENIERLKELLSNSNENVKIKVNGKEFSFLLKKENIEVVPENFSVDYKDIPKTLLLDIGYRNLNINVIEEGEMLQEFMKHTETGIIELKNIIALELETVKNTNYSEKEITDYIVLNGIPTDKKSLEIIKNAKIKYLKNIKNKIQEVGIKIELNNKIAIRGGGTLLFTVEEFKEVFPEHGENSNIIFEGNEFKNTEIFIEIGKVIFQ